MYETRTSNPTTAARLEHRYPGVRCHVERSEFKPERADEPLGKGHALWILHFSCEDLAALIGYGLATAAQFEALAGRGRFDTRDGIGNRVYIGEQAPPDRRKVYDVTTYRLNTPRLLPRSCRSVRRRNSDCGNSRGPLPTPKGNGRSPRRTR